MLTAGANEATNLSKADDHVTLLSPMLTQTLSATLGLSVTNVSGRDGAWTVLALAPLRANLEMDGHGKLQLHQPSQSPQPATPVSL